MGVLPGLRPALERAGYGALCLALALLPLQGFGNRPLRPALSLIVFDLLVAVALPLSALRLARELPAWLRAPAAWMPLSLALAGFVSELAQAEPRLSARLLEQAAPLIVAALIGAHASDRARREGLVAAALLGGAGALGVAVVGWCLDLAAGTGVFAQSGAHPIFDGLPRLVGSFGGAAQRAGAFAIYVLTLALAGRLVLPRLARSIAAPLALLALALSMSFAWLGGAMLAAFSLSRRWRLGALALTLIATAVASVPLLLGPKSTSVLGDCAALDAEHYLVAPAAPGRCLRLSEGGRAITRYAEAKRSALAALVTSPVFGVGYRGFSAFSDRAFAERYALSGEHYEQPHGVIPGLAAKHGALGALVVPLWLWLLYRGWRDHPYDFGIAAFLLIGLYMDVDRLRELWVLWGLLAAVQGASTPRPEVEQEGWKAGRIFLFEPAPCDSGRRAGPDGVRSTGSERRASPYSEG